MDTNTFCNFVPYALTWIRPLLAAWCIMLVFLCFIITTQRAQRKKLYEIEHFLKPGAKVITRNGIAGIIIAVFHNTLVLELASGQKKEIPKYLVDHATSD